MSRRDLYEGFADSYDRFHGELGRYNPMANGFFNQVFVQHQVQSLLDCACGTGQHLPLFHSLGCDVAGSDISEGMLAQARKNLTGYGLEVPLHKLDFRELPRYFDRKFDAVMCLSSSFMHIATEAELLRAFGSMRGILRKGAYWL